MLNELLRTLRKRLRRWLEDRRRFAAAPHVERKKKTHRHPRFYLDATHGPLQRYAYTAMTALFLCVFVYCAWQLGSYGLEYVRARQASAALRDAYYAQEELATPVPSPTSTPEPTLPPTPTPSPRPGETPAPTPTPRVSLPVVKYPGNEYALANSRFMKLRRQNADIVGWLTIEDMIDEAVVQRDNEYYLARDYRGYHNKNGAIFMDESIDLSTRPYTIILYGHNMKTGLMFGGLRNYENINFYRKNPFVTFDSAYEEGRYVIFAVATIGVESSSWKYVNLWQLCTDNIARRKEAIDQLRTRSLYRSAIDVKEDDQLLLLVTCVENDDERRVVAARRVREGEKEADLQKLVNKAQTR